jgi:DNA-binding MarR family transcriptional regulator
MSAASARLPCVAIRLRRATRALTQLYDDAMAPSGLHLNQFSLLKRSRARADLHHRAGRRALDRTALSRNLDPLVARGLVAIAPGRDARTREVAITPAGEAAIQAALPYWKRAQHEVVGHLGAARLDALLATLAEIEILHPSSAVQAPAAPEGARHVDRA